MLLRSAPVRVQPFFGYRSHDRLRISARALRAALPQFRRSGRWQAMRTLLAQFASREVAELSVTLEIVPPDGRPRGHQARTDAEGYVHFDLALEPAWEYPAQPRWETVSLLWKARGREKRVEGHVLVPGRDTGLGVISDIDDTIIETGITGGFRQILRNWRRILLELPDQRLLVPGADVFYSALGGSEMADAEKARTGPPLNAAQVPFFYVSSSPWNLFSYLVAFQQSRKLPLGPLLLRDWGVNRATLGSASHGDHKREAIARLLETYPEIRFALIGDDTQGDLLAFAECVATHPRRVRAVFIRQAGEPLSAEEEQARDVIRSAGVPLWMGDTFASGEAFLKEIGLAHDGEAERIVQTVEKAGPSAGTPKT